MRIKRISCFKPILVALALAIMSTSGILGQGRNSKNNTGTDNTQIFIEAKKQMILGDVDKAEKLFQTCIETNPADGASYYELSRINLARKQYEIAIEQAGKAVDADPMNEWYMIHLASLYKQTSQFTEAAAVMEDLLSKYPDRYEYYNDLAVTYLFSRDYDKAIDVYQKVEDKYGINEETSIQKHKVYLLQNNQEKAIAEIENLVIAFPTEPQYHSMLAELYMASGQTEKALSSYNRVLELDPGNPYIHISLSDYYRKTGDYQKSYNYLKQGFSNPELDIDTKVNILLAYYTAIEFYDEKKEEAFELSGILIETHPDNPKAYSIRADLLFQAKDFGKAREDLRKVISLDSSRYLVWEQLLFTEAELQDFASMKLESKRAIDLFPQQPLPYLFNAVANFQDKDFTAAISSLEKGIRFVIDNELLLAQFHSYLGDAYHETKNNEKAFQAYEKALKINPENSIVLNNYAYYLSLENLELEKALQMAEKAIELDPDNGSNQDTYGWILYKLERYEEAKEWVGKAIKNHNEENSVVLEHYGDILFKLGESHEAMKYWKKARNAGGETSEFIDKKIQDGKLYE